MSLEDARDIVIIVYGVVGILLFVVLLFLAVLVFFALKKATRAFRELLEDPIRPTLEEVRGTAQNIRGTSEFIADTAVHPLIRVVAITRGVRRGVGSLAGLRRRG